MRCIAERRSAAQLVGAACGNWIETPAIGAYSSSKRRICFILKSPYRGSAILFPFIEKYSPPALRNKRTAFPFCMVYIARQSQDAFINLKSKRRNSHEKHSDPRTGTGNSGHIHFGLCRHRRAQTQRCSNHFRNQTAGRMRRARRSRQEAKESQAPARRAAPKR